MTFLDLFAGVGGFRRGLELAGHKCVGFCEWDKFAAASYTSMHLITDDQRAHLATMELKKRQKEILKEEYRNGEWYSADVRLIRGDNVPRADCWCFGAPCQDFSVAGQRKGLDGDRSSLVREVFRVLGELEEEYRPEWLIYENVKGMLSSNRGWDFLAIILEMEQLGYDVEWELFNTKNFGVPQNRERVYTVGHLRSRGERKIFPLKGADGEDSIYEVTTSVIGGIGEINFGKQFREGNRVYDGTKIATALKAASVGNAGGATNLYGVALCLNKMDGGGREPHIPVQFGIDYNVQGEESEIANCLKAKYDAGVSNFKHDRTAVAIPVLTPDRPVKRQNGRRFKDNGDESFTLTAQDRHGVAVEVKALGGLYTQDSPDHHRGILKDTARCLKTGQHDSAVALKVDVKALGVIDRQGRLDKQVEIKNVSPTLRAQTHGNPPEVCLPIKEATKQGYAIAHEGDSINLSIPGSKTRRGRVGNGVANTLDCKCEQGVFVKLSDDLTVYAVWYEKYQCYIAIRKLTPRECFRLQGWTDDYFEKAAFVNSDSQLYKQAGNGVTVNVVQTIGEAIKEK